MSYHICTNFFENAVEFACKAESSWPASFSTVIKDLICKVYYDNGL